MFQMISTAFPPERDIWREFGSNATVMRVSGRGRGMGRIPFSLRSCAISLSFFYFFLSSLLLSIFFWGYLLSHLLFFVFFITVQLLSCSYLAAHQWAKSQHFISLCSVHNLFFLPFIYKILPFFWEHCQIQPQIFCLNRKATWKDQLVLLEPPQKSVRCVCALHGSLRMLGFPAPDGVTGRIITHTPTSLDSTVAKISS